MEREKITTHTLITRAQIEETRIRSFDKNDSSENTFRVYDGECMGIQYVQGRCFDEEGFAQAQENLSLRRPYKFTPETGSRHRDKSETRYSDREVLDIAREALDYLKSRHPDFIFRGYAEARHRTVAMTNTLGLDYSNTDGNITLSLGFKHKDSRDITDGWFEIGQRTYDPGKFTAMADNYLTNFTNTAELPEELIIQEQYYGYLGMFYSCLNARNMALGTSLLSGRAGERIFADDFSLLHNVSDEESWDTPFFDGEGAVNPDDRQVFIENGVLLTGFSDKKAAEEFGVPHTANAGFSNTDLPQPGFVNMQITRSSRTVKELLGGRLTVVPIITTGGGYNEKGEYVTTVHTALLCDGERFIGRVPEFTMKGSMFDIFGKDFIGVGSDDPVFNDKQILMRMNYSK